MSPRNVTGKFAVRKCGEAYTEWNYNIIGSDNFCTNQNSTQVPYIYVKELTGE
jgi:hypothetical protein